MAEDLSKSLLIRSIKKSGSLMALVGPWLPIPYVGAAGQVIEKLPIEEGVEWAKKAMKQHSKPAEEAQPVAVSAIQPAVTLPVGNEPMIVESEHRPKVAEQIAKTFRSEPFEIALEQAVAALPAKIESALAATSKAMFDVGVWPAFFVETIARGHFKSELGGSVAATSRPEVATLIEVGLAAEAIQLFRAGIEASKTRKPAGIELSSRFDVVRLWSEDPDFEWPGTATLSQGYFVGRHEMKDMSDFQVPKNEAQRLYLLGQLGKMGLAQLENLTKAWMDAADTLTAGKDPEGVVPSKLAQFNIAVR